MLHRNARLRILFSSALAVLLLSAGMRAQENPSPGIDLTKGSAGLTNDNARLSPRGVPREEANAKNELHLISPALVVGPVMEGVGRPRLSRWRHEMIGQRVEVEGLALGEPPPQPSQMTTQRVVYEGGMMFIRGVDFAKSGATGKLARVSGTLQLEPESFVFFGGHDPVVVEKYYYIEAEALELVDRVSESRLVAPQLHR